MLGFLKGRPGDPGQAGQPGHPAVPGLKGSKVFKASITNGHLVPSLFRSVSPVFGAFLHMYEELQLKN